MYRICSSGSNQIFQIYDIFTSSKIYSSTMCCCDGVTRDASNVPLFVFRAAIGPAFFQLFFCARARDTRLHLSIKQRAVEDRRHPIPSKIIVIFSCDNSRKISSLSLSLRIVIARFLSKFKLIYKPRNRQFG